jgi:ATP synthase protein I
MKQTNGPLKSFMFVGLIGMDLSITTVGGFWLGRFLDRKLDTEPLFLIVGVVFGLAIGIFSLVPLVKSFIGGKQ